MKHIIEIIEKKIKELDFAIDLLHDWNYLKIIMENFNLTGADLNNKEQDLIAERKTLEHELCVLQELIIKGNKLI